MGHLDWKDSTVVLEVAPETRPETRPKTQIDTRLKSLLVLKIQSVDLPVFIQNLEQVYCHQEGELRLELPQNWVLYWKTKENASRVLLAHPQPERWVATFALELALAEN